jgi:hypothetical protein
MPITPQLTLGQMTNYNALSNPGGQLNTAIPQSLNQLSLTPSTGLSSSALANAQRLGLGNGLSIASGGAVNSPAQTSANATYKKAAQAQGLIPATPVTPAATGATGTSLSSVTPAATGATGTSLSSVYSGTNSSYTPITPTGSTGATDPNAGATATGSTGATGSTLPTSYYNADGTLKTPAQVASEVGNSLFSAHTNGDVGNLAMSQFTNPDGGTTADAQAAAAQINNTKNDISTGATDPYNVAGSSGIAYTPEELDAIQKAYAGVYTPALNTALAKVTLKQSEDKAALDQQNQLAQIDEQAKATVAAQANAPYTLGTGDIRYDAQGNQIAAGPENYQNALLNGGGASMLSQYMRTTASGNKYIDLSTVTDPTENAALQNAARSEGIMPVTTDQAQKLQNIDDTRTNLAQISAQFAKIGGSGPVQTLFGSGIPQEISGAFGNADVGSFQAWRTAAINSIQALAGGSGSGVRINQAEINAAMENDIPSMGDTIAQANAKVQVLNNQLNNWENEILNTTGSTGTGATGSSSTETYTTPDGTFVKNSDGSYTMSPGNNSVGNTTASTLQQAPTGTYSSETLNRPQRNNNPGDLKPGGIADKYASGVTPQGDLMFSSPAVGFNALSADVSSKINGGSKYLAANPTISQLGTVYAEDPNWAAGVAKALKVSPDTKTQSIPLPALVRAIATQEGFFA